MVFLRPFYMYNNNLYPKSSRNYVLLRAGLNKAGQSCPFGQKGWIGRPWLARPSKGHNFWNFLGINSYSTRKKVSNKPKFGGPLIFEHFKSRFSKSGLLVNENNRLASSVILAKTLHSCFKLAWSLLFSCF